MSEAATDKACRSDSRSESAVTETSGHRFAPARWRPSTLLAIFIVCVFLAEFTDVIILHRLRYSSIVTEGMIDGLTFLAILSPAYFLFFLPLKVHWQKEQQAKEEVRQLNHKLLLAAEDERRLLALELHDHFGQAVTTLQCKLDKIQRRLAGTDTVARQECQSLAETISQLGYDIRQFTTALRPDMLDDLGLAETLTWYVGELMQNHPALQVEFRAVGIKQRLPAGIEIALYRVCQEALNNIVKHASASQVNVTLTYSHPMIILSVRDNGSGLPEVQSVARGSARQGFGLLGMRERVAALGGTLEISSRRGERTTVRVLIPVRQGEA